MKRIEYKKINDEKYKYELTRLHNDYTGIKRETESKGRYITLYDSGVISIKEGYRWDGASGPTIDCEESMRASLLHDALYQLMRVGFLSKQYRKEADLLFYQVLREDGMNFFRALYYYWAVRLFGGGYIK